MLRFSILSFPDTDSASSILLHAIEREDHTAIRCYQALRKEAMHFATRTINQGVASKALANSYRIMYLILKIDGDFRMGSSLKWLGSMQKTRLASEDLLSTGLSSWSVIDCQGSQSDHVSHV